MFAIDQSNTSTQFGDMKVSAETQNGWDAARFRREKALRYYSGQIFTETIPVEDPGETAPLLYPVGLNIVKMITLAITDATFGEWDTEIMMFEPRKSIEVSDGLKNASKLAMDMVASSNGASTFWEMDFNRNLYGAGVLRISQSMNAYPYIKWANYPVDGFFPIFDPENPDVLLECYAQNYLTEEQVRNKYRIDPLTLTAVTTPGSLVGNYYIRTEHWTLHEYEVLINGAKIPAYSGQNPWGVIPFVYIPRMRTIDWMGESVVEDLFTVQDELNMRVADIGEELNYNSHPIRWGRNLPMNFDSKNFPLGANVMWNLGKAYGSGVGDPEVGMLQSDHPVPEAAFSYIKFVYDWARTSSSAPPVAFGEDNGGGQRSGATLEIRLWPMLKSIRRSRSYLETGLQRALFVSGKILAQRKFSDVGKDVIDSLVNGQINPVFHRILPRDQATVVDEVVKLLSTNPPSISLETAQTILGRGQSEISHIEDTIELRQKIDQRAAENAAKIAEANKPEETKAPIE